MVTWTKKMDINTVSVLLSLLATFLSVVAILKNALDAVYHYVRMNLFKRFTGAYLISRLVAASNEYERSSVLAMCASRCACFDENQLFELWSVMFFYWASNNSSGAVNEFFKALEATSSTAEKALQSLCTMIHNNPRSCPILLLQAFKRFLNCNGFTSMGAECLRAVDKAIKLLEANYVDLSKFFSFTEYMGMCLSIEQHHSIDTFNTVWHFSTMTNISCQVTKSKLGSDCIMHLNDLLYQFQIGTQRFIYTANMFMFVGSIMHESRVHLSAELFQTLANMDVLNPDGSERFWKIWYRVG
jgi:hypothetical protein